MKINTLPSPDELALLAGVDTVELPEPPQAAAPEADALQAPEADALQAQVTDLQAQVATGVDALAAAQAEVAALQAAAVTSSEALASAQAEVTQANATIEALAPAVRNTVKHLAVALNKAEKGDTLSAQDLASTYASYATDYAEAFKAGKVSKTPVAVDDKGTKPPVQKPVGNTMFALAAKSI